MDLEKVLEAGLPEFRSMPFLDFEAEDDGWGFHGLASPYDEVADIGDFTEEFMRGTYRRVLARGENTRLVYDHSPPHVPVLATRHGGTVEFKEDARGLAVRGRIAKHYIGEATRELINRGDIKGMSPGFVVGKGNAEMTLRAKPHRRIKDLKHLLEVSLTPDPAYAGTTAEMRSLWAYQMAEALGQSQHAFVGAYSQLESRATDPEADTGDEPAKTDCDACGNSPCECAPVDEQRSGADAQAAAAARTRALHLLGLQLPS